MPKAYKALQYAFWRYRINWDGLRAFWLQYKSNRYYNNSVLRMIISNTRKKFEGRMQHYKCSRSCRSVDNVIIVWHCLWGILSARFQNFRSASFLHLFYKFWYITPTFSHDRKVFRSNLWEHFLLRVGFDNIITVRMSLRCQSLNKSDSKAPFIALLNSFEVPKQEKSIDTYITGHWNCYLYLYDWQWWLANSTPNPKFQFLKTALWTPRSNELSNQGESQWCVFLQNLQFNLKK